MKVIKSLTKSQEKQIPKYIDKWVGKASEPINHVKAKKYINLMYKQMGEEKPVIIIGNSPMNTCLLACLFKNLIEKTKDNKTGRLKDNLHKQLRNQLYSQLHKQLDNQLDNQLYNQLYNQLDSQLEDQLRSQLDSQLGSQLYSQLHDQLHSQLHSQLYSQLGSQLRSQLRSQLDKINSGWYMSFWWLIWCGWCEYAQKIGVKFDKQKFDLFMGFVSEISFIIPYKGICFISEKPTEINWSNKLLHKDLGLAVKYSDGYGLYCLNGVTMPEKYITTPAEKLDAKLILEEKNADVRRELVRKIGVEKVVEKLGAKTIDKDGDYELLSVNIGDSRVRPYLKMLNPSIKQWHIEGVRPEIKTVKEALAWRNSMDNYTVPIKLT